MVDDGDSANFSLSDYTGPSDGDDEDDSYQEECGYECSICHQPCQDSNDGLMHECQCGALHLSQPPGLAESSGQERGDDASREASRGSSPTEDERFDSSPVGEPSPSIGEAVDDEQPRLTPYHQQLADEAAMSRPVLTPTESDDDGPECGVICEFCDARCRQPQNGFNHLCMTPGCRGAHEVRYDLYIPEDPFEGLDEEQIPDMLARHGCVPEDWLCGVQCPQCERVCYNDRDGEEHVCQLCGLPHSSRTPDGSLIIDLVEYNRQRGDAAGEEFHSTHSSPREVADPGSAPPQGPSGSSQDHLLSQDSVQPNRRSAEERLHEALDRQRAADEEPGDSSQDISAQLESMQESFDRTQVLIDDIPSKWLYNAGSSSEDVTVVRGEIWDSTLEADGESDDSGPPETTEWLPVSSPFGREVTDPVSVSRAEGELEESVRMISDDWRHVEFPLPSSPSLCSQRYHNESDPPTDEEVKLARSRARGSADPAPEDSPPDVTSSGSDVGTAGPTVTTDATETRTCYRFGGHLIMDGGITIQSERLCENS